MAWRRSGDKPLSEPVMVSLLTHICVTRPQWVNTLWPIDAIWWHRPETALALVMAWFLTAPVHYLNQFSSDSSSAYSCGNHWECWRYKSLNCVWKLNIWKHNHICQGTMSWSILKMAPDCVNKIVLCSKLRAVIKRCSCEKKKPRNQWAVDFQTCIGQKCGPLCLDNSFHVTFCSQSSHHDGSR